MSAPSGLVVPRDNAAHMPKSLKEDISSQILATTGTVCFLSLICVSLRLFARTCMIRRLGWEDLSIFVAALLVLGSWICFVLEAQSGVLGRHMNVVTVPQYEKFLFWTFPHQLFQTIGICLVKCSVAFFLTRIDRTVWCRRVMCGSMVLMVICTLVFASALFWSCIPLRANWHLEEQKNAKIISTKVWIGLGIWNSVLNMLTDAILALWPIPTVIKMKVSLMKKMSLCVALSLGWLAVVCGAIKTYNQWTYFAAVDNYFEDKYFVWSFLELSVGALAASFPLLQPYVHLLRRASHDNRVQEVAVPRDVTSHEEPHPVVRKPIITWTGMGFTSLDEGTTLGRTEELGKNGSIIVVDLEKADSLTQGRSWTSSQETKVASGGAMSVELP